VVLTFARGQFKTHSAQLLSFVYQKQEFPVAVMLFVNSV
jgi:hypothetical protein